MTVDVLAERAVAALLSARWMIATAESCTGGLIAERVTALAGTSRCYERGFVVYSNAAKQQMLGVAETLIESHGAVSEPVVRAMAEGALTRSGADLGIAISGIAGPTGGSAEKPVGTVWLAVACADESLTEHHVYTGDRSQIRRAAADDALLRIASCCERWS